MYANQALLHCLGLRDSVAALVVPVATMYWVPPASTVALIAASAGIVLFGLLRTPLRWSGAAMLMLSVIWALAVPQPDILISADGHNVGVRGRDGRLHLMRTTKDAFLLKEWLAADADARSVTDASLNDGISCDDAGPIVKPTSRSPSARWRCIESGCIS